MQLRQLRRLRMSRITCDEILRVLNGGPAGTWFVLDEVMEGVETSLGTTFVWNLVRDTFVRHLKDLVSWGHAVSDSRGEHVRYQITPLGQNWLTKHYSSQKAG